MFVQLFYKPVVFFLFFYHNSSSKNIQIWLKSTQVHKKKKKFRALSPSLDFDSSFHGISDVLPPTVWTICQHTAAPWRPHSHTAAGNGLPGFTANELGKALWGTEGKAGMGD